MAKQIELTQEQIATVCDCHYHLVGGYNWQATWNKSKRQFEATRNPSVKERLGGAPHQIRMHVVINGTAKGVQTDHINNNSLDNRCSNLRNATPSENGRNRTKNENNTSGYKGVSWDKMRSKWRARIGLNGKDISLGRFDSAEDAARMYDSAAQKLHGRFARTNF